MASHFDSIGVPSSDGDELRRSLAMAIERAARVGEADGHRVLVDEDPSGVRLAFTLDPDGVLTCLTPGFSAGNALDVVVQGFADDPCPFETPLLVDVVEGEEPCYPLAIQVEDLAVSRPAFVGDGRLRLAVAAFAESVTVFPDESAYRASGTPMAVESLIPSGTFAVPGNDEGFQVSPRILMSGRVVHREVRRHTLYDREFAYLRVASLCHEYEVVAPVHEVPPGDVVSGTFWLSGRRVGVTRRRSARHGPAVTGPVWRV